RVVFTLVLAAQVEHGVDAVRDERLPAGLAQLADAVGPDHRAEASLAAVHGSMAAEIADVEAAVPDEVSRRQLQLARRRAMWPKSRPRSGPAPARPAAPPRRRRQSCCAGCGRAAAPRPSGWPPPRAPPRRGRRARGS